MAVTVAEKRDEGYVDAKAGKLAANPAVKTARPKRRDALLDLASRFGAKPR